MLNVQEMFMKSQSRNYHITTETELLTRRDTYMKILLIIVWIHKYIQIRYC